MGLLLLAVYGAFGLDGLDGLAHYTLALCSEHSLWTNITIWCEALVGLGVLLVAAVYFTRSVRAPWAYRAV